MGDVETLPAVLLANAARFGARVALRPRRYGTWQETTHDAEAVEGRNAFVEKRPVNFARFRK